MVKFSFYYWILVVFPLLLNVMNANGMSSMKICLYIAILLRRKLIFSVTFVFGVSITKTVWGGTLAVQ